MTMNRNQYLRKQARCMASALAMAVALGTHAVMAEEFSIAEQPLASSLLEFSNQAKLVVVAPPALVENIQAPALHGNMEPMVALEALLEGSNLHYTRSKDGGIMIVEAQQTLAGLGKASAEAKSNDQVSFVLEEIIVTATRREASMQDIPMSIAAYSSDVLRDSGVHNIQDLQMLAAGLQIQMVGAQANVTLRGVGAQQGAVGAESGVAVHRDGVYVKQRPEIAMGFFDIERVEVLRGPQGTLYGRNATGGAVNIISKSPTDDFEAGASATLGNYSLVETEGFVSGPIAGDTLTARVAFKTRDHDGYTANIFDGKALDDGDFSGLRGVLRYQPTSDLRLDLTAEYGKENGVWVSVRKRTRTGEPLGVETQEGASLASGRAVNQDGPNINEKEAWGVNAKLTWDVGDLTLSSLSAYRKFNWLESFDFDGTDVHFGFFDKGYRNTKQITQELTLASASDQQLNWLVGGYYFRSVENNSINTVLPTIDFFSIVTTDDYTTDAYAAFGEASYALLEQLELTVGARYSHEKKVIPGTRTYRGVTTAGSKEDSWGSFTPKVALVYSASDDLSFYATVGKGFKAGGYNGANPLGNPFGSYAPEEVVNYEAGVKSALLDNRLRANLSIFHMDYTNLQNSARVPHPTIPDAQTGAVVNAGEATIRGVEFEFDAKVSDSLSVDGNLSYLDAVFASFTNANQNGATVDASGNHLQNAPEWAFNMAVDYTVPVGDWGSASFRGEWAYKSRVHFTPFADNYQSQPGTSVINARLAFTDADDQWTIAAWVKNLTDEVIANSKTEDISLFSGGTWLNYQPPRTYGLTVGYKF